MKRVKTIARPVLKDAACSTGCGECQTHVSQHARLHAQLLTRSAKTLKEDNQILIF